MSARDRLHTPGRGELDRRLRLALERARGQEEAYADVVERLEEPDLVDLHVLRASLVLKLAAISDAIADLS